MTEHTASCRCGQLRATVTEEPVRVDPVGDLEHSH